MLLLFLLFLRFCADPLRRSCPATTEHWRSWQPHGFILTAGSLFSVSLCVPLWFKRCCCHNSFDAVCNSITNRPAVLYASRLPRRQFPPKPERGKGKGNPGWLIVIECLRRGALCIRDTVLSLVHLISLRDAVASRYFRGTARFWATSRYSVETSTVKRRSSRMSKSL